MNNTILFLFARVGARLRRSKSIYKIKNPFKEVMVILTSKVILHIRIQHISLAVFDLFEK